MIGSFLGGEAQERHKEKKAKIATKEVHTSPLERSALPRKPPFVGRITRLRKASRISGPGKAKCIM
jgi:hypothetical protein